MMGFEIVMLLFEAQMVVIVLEIIASGRNSVIMAMGTTCSVSLTLCTLSISLRIVFFSSRSATGTESERQRVE
ncbi:MAG: hypothetical protein DMG17_28105 [Acidobacteria bacterium]|nr:MAG: hypothetical protein AUI91_00580 [Acidobacteria bacterium 13_1_40CM_3_56_11]PYS08868.1 MAG: hypothetical protein DMG17_28105 [Acidobacteriota bacterium]